MNAVVDLLRHEANAKLDPQKKGALGQFMTPFSIAQFMAEMFTKSGKPAVLLDAGAGIGSLTIAASKVLNLQSVEAWEVDSVMQSYLLENLEGLNVPFVIHKQDFIHDSVNRLQFNTGSRFTHAILNPPYKKINSNSQHRHMLRALGVETVNLYTAFLALAILQMVNGGEIVIITPRSFCNGPYYKPFRELLLSKCSVDAIHVFESRSKAFKDDDVLQENIILKLTRSSKQQKVQLSFSDDPTFSVMERRLVDFTDIVKPDDKELFIHIPREEDASQSHGLFSHTLAQLNLAVCTGPVVDFRLKEWWCAEPQQGSIPLLYPHHFGTDGFQYPKAHKKPNALIPSPEVNKWLMPTGFYVIVKRFSSKEERRRVVAYFVSPTDLKSEFIGFENHWNVIHFQKKGLAKDVAKGMTSFLNSTVLDNYFRVFSGHTQVNATDLRNMKYPSLEQLKQLGALSSYGMSQEAIDNLLMQI
jgi:adenine-specific DNA-methyltransferase